MSTAKKNFKTFTRVYKDSKAANGVATQKFTVDLASIAAVRASNALQGQRSTITVGGTEYALMDTSSSIKTLLGVRG